MVDKDDMDLVTIVISTGFVFTIDKVVEAKDQSTVSVQIHWNIDKVEFLSLLPANWSEHLRTTLSLQKRQLVFSILSTNPFQSWQHEAEPGGGHRSEGQRPPLGRWRSQACQEKIVNIKIVLNSLWSDLRFSRFCLFYFWERKCYIFMGIYGKFWLLGCYFLNNSRNLVIRMNKHSAMECPLLTLDCCL